MKKQQRTAILTLAVLAGAVTSVAVPLLLESFQVRSALIWIILAPGFSIFPVIHMPLAGGIMIVLFDGISYMLVGYVFTRLMLRADGHRRRLNAERKMISAKLT